MKEETQRIGRRDFLQLGMVAGLGIIIPEIISCRTKEPTGVGNGLSKVTLNDLTGNSVAIPTDAAGKIAIIHFWASWCPTCRGEMVTLDAIGGKYRGKGVMPYSIGIGEKKETAMSYINKLGITYPVLLDPGSITQKKFGISGIPTYYILDRAGIIRYKIFGEAEKNGLDKMIQALL
jgi:cytochrome c biogenesis protein CcmG, thiol:disulfide interchange protein DsbE